MTTFGGAPQAAKTSCIETRCPGGWRIASLMDFRGQRRVFLLNNPYVESAAWPLANP